MHRDLQVHPGLLAVSGCTVQWLMSMYEAPHHLNRLSAGMIRASIPKKVLNRFSKTFR